METVYGPGVGGDEPLPGAYPFTRGVHPDMYRGKPWTLRQYAGYTSPRETNGRFHRLLAAGQTGLSVAFDLPTQMGYDSDHTMAEGEVGRVGVPVSCLADMESLLEGIPLGEVSLSMTINATAPVLVALLAATARRRGFPLARLSGTVQNDILKEFVARSTHRFPAGPSLRLVTDVLEYCAREMPRFNPISISGYHIREAGADAVQELAYTFCHAIAYVEAARERGIDLAALGARLSFFFGCHRDFLEEVAKFRAARRVWAGIMRDRFGITDDAACRLRFHTQTCGCTLTAQQPDNNVVRVALQALAAVLGGTQSLHTNAKDEALGLPSEATALVALRTQQVIAHETGVADVADPVGGSYAIEALTRQIERRVLDEIASIERAGGALRAIESGLIQRRIRETAYREQREVDAGERAVVGVNRHRDGDATEAGGMRLDPSIARERAMMLKRWRAARDAGRCDKTMAAVRKASSGIDNLLPPLIDAVDAGATTGEITRTLTEVFGEA